MQDVAIALENRPGALAEMGAALGQAALSIEGGGAFAVDGKGVAHFLFEDGLAARQALERAGIHVLAVRDVVVQRLDQNKPGQLGELTRHMAAAGVNIEVLYSDHDHQMILVVDDPSRAREVSAQWTREQSTAKELTCGVHLEWTGNLGEGTKTYRGYRRDHVITAEGKPPIPGTSDPAFRGDPERYSPEELLVAGLSSCHMLSYLHLCSTHGVNVTEYRDAPSGVLGLDTGGKGKMIRVTLKPAVTIDDGAGAAKAQALHAEAHHLCFLARSVNFPIDVVPVVRPRDIIEGF
ncbi:MAG: OsmC family protein [Candidatus Solibacter sp.]|nr:OsmC family protein [Candidatus Solibacter sp.]